MLGDSEAAGEEEALGEPEAFVDGEGLCLDFNKSIAEVAEPEGVGEVIGRAELVAVELAEGEG